MNSPTLERWWLRLRSLLNPKTQPDHLARGSRGETVAADHLRRTGLKFLTANYRTTHGEIDLVFRDQDCLVFVEVKTRSSELWSRPAAAVNAAKRRRISRAALQYIRGLDDPRVKFRFDIVEVLLDHDALREIRHIPNAFPLSSPYRHH
jgi:putative endonuclease